MAASVQAPRRGWRLRPLLVVVHRYVGLAIATFIIVAALTGSVMAFYHQLSDILAPAPALRAPAGAVALEPFAFHERLLAQLPAGVAPDTDPPPVPFQRATDTPYRWWVQMPVPGSEERAWRELLFDPVSGELLGERQRTTGLAVLDFLFKLHYSLALGTVGGWLMGIAALLWAFDCCVGMYLTFPPARPPGAAPARRSWLGRWRPSWLVRATSLFGTVFTFHRASGLWLWPLLFVLAWSSVGLNLHDQVFRPAMRAVGLGASDALAERPERETAHLHPALDLRAAHAVGQRLMAEEAAARGFAIDHPGELHYAPRRAMYTYAVRSGLDLPGNADTGTRIAFDADTGARIAFEAPTGVTAGDTVHSWLFALHMGRVWGLPYRIILSLAGIVIVALSVTGVWIWWRKRNQRRRAAIPAETTHMPAP